MVTIEELNDLAKSDLWKEDSAWVSKIFNQFTDYILKHGDYPGFGNDRFWAAVLGEQVGDGEEVTYELTEDKKTNFARFKSEATVFKLRFNSNDVPKKIVRRAFDEAIERAFKDTEPNELVGLMVEHKYLHTPIIIPFSSADKFTTHNLTTIIDAVRQSHLLLKYDCDLLLTFTRIAK